MSSPRPKSTSGSATPSELAPGTQPTSDSDRAPDRDPKSWAFWRLRLARALFIGGIAFAAGRLFPGLPQEQHLLFEAPAGAAIRDLDLSWRRTDDASLIGGAELKPTAPAPRLSHRFRAPHGQYTLQITARMDTCMSAPCESTSQNVDQHTLSLERTVELAGDTTRVSLTER